MTAAIDSILGMTDFAALVIVAGLVALALVRDGRRRDRDRHGLDGLQRIAARARVVRATPAMISPRRRP